MRGGWRTSGERGGIEIFVGHPWRCYRGLRERNQNIMWLSVQRRHPWRCDCVLLKRKRKETDRHDHRVGFNDCSKVGGSAAKQFSDFIKSIQNGNTERQGVGGGKRTLRS